MTIFETDRYPLGRRITDIKTSVDITGFDNLVINHLNRTDDLARLFLDYTPEVISSYTINRAIGSVSVLKIKESREINHILQLSHQFSVIFVLTGLLTTDNFQQVLTQEDLLATIANSYNSSDNLQNKTTIRTFGGIKKNDKGTFT